jgi:hypothetical protein
VHCRVKSCQYKGMYVCMYVLCMYVCMYVGNRNPACLMLIFITIWWKSDWSLSNTIKRKRRFVISYIIPECSLFTL